jgi:hypothetical protein
LSDEIASIEAKYNMVLDEKDRNEILLRSKMAITKKTYQEFQADLNGIKTEIEDQTLCLSNLNRDNITLLQTCENR